MTSHLIIVIIEWAFLSWGVIGLAHHTIHGYEADIHHIEQMVVYYFLLGPIMWALKLFQGLMFLTMVTMHYVENWETFIKFKHWLFKP